MDLPPGKDGLYIATGHLNSSFLVEDTELCIPHIPSHIFRRSIYSDRIHVNDSLQHRWPCLGNRLLNNDRMRHISISDETIEMMSISNKFDQCASQTHHNFTGLTAVSYRDLMQIKRTSNALATDVCLFNIRPSICQIFWMNYLTSMGKLQFTWLFKDSDSIPSIVYCFIANK